MRSGYALPLAVCVLLAGCYDFDVATHCKNHPARCELRVDGISPASGPAEAVTKVIITGTGFDPDVEVFVGEVQVFVEARTQTRLDVIVPSHPPGSGAVEVRSVGRRAASLIPFEWVSGLTPTGPGVPVPQPTMTDVSPKIVPPTGGVQVEITGTHLDTAERVSFGTAAGHVVTRSPTRLVVEAPQLLERGFLWPSVTTSGGSATGPEMYFGDRWYGVTTSFVSVDNVVQDPFAANVAYVETNLAVFRSTDAAESFDFTYLLQGRTVTGWAFSATHTVVGTDAGLWHSTDRGVTWQQAQDRRPVTAVALLSQSEIYGVIGGALHVTANLGDAWTPVGTISAVSLAASGDTLFIGDAASVRSLSAGSSITTTVAAVPATKMAIAPGPVLMVSDGQATHTVRPGFVQSPVAIPGVVAFSPSVGSAWIVAAPNALYRVDADGVVTSLVLPQSKTPVSVAGSAVDVNTALAAFDGALWKTVVATWP